MKKSQMMKASLEDLKAEAQKHLDDGKVEDAQAKMNEIKNLKSAIQMQETLEVEEEEKLEMEHEAQEQKENKTKETANAIRAMIKKIGGGTLTQAENALLLPTTEAPSGTSGEGYILPEDVSTIIRNKLREYKSFRDVVGYMPATSLTGSFPIENFETVTGLIDFTDGTDGVEGDDIKFTNKTFALKEKAAFLKLSNTLLSLTDNALIGYVAEVFAKKAVVTENSMAVNALKTGKTLKKIAGWKALKSSINTDLDPAVLFGAVIVTNQNGFNYLDSELDTTGRPILQPNPTDPTRPLFKGYPIVTFSNALLPSIAATTTQPEKTPIFYGNLSEAVKFVDLSGQIQFATSKEAGFMSNTTVARLIEFIDTVQCDASDRCYIYGEMETAPKNA